MQFALLNSTRTLPLQTGLRACCPGCESEVVARCGEQRVHHWAHLQGPHCSFSREPETSWHRGWKEKFPAPWREFMHRDPAGEKHMADVRTEHGLAIEFQYSPINPEEQRSRERAYGNMVWVVDGSRLKGDLPRFRKGMRSSHPIAKPWIRIVPFPDETFPRSWVNRAAPVIFDFEGAKGLNEPIEVCRALWCLLPGQMSGHTIVVNLAREGFVELAHQRADWLPTTAISKHIEAALLSAARQRRAAEVRHQPRRQHVRHGARRF